MKKNIPLFLLLAMLVLIVVLVIFNVVLGKNLLVVSPKVTPQEIAQKYAPTPTPSPSPTPTPKPLTFAEMNSLYGPCVHLPTLMYHHIQSLDTAKEKNQTSLTVTPETFQTQIGYLKEKGYSTVYMSDLVNFFDTGTKIPAKSILITFDDGYDDFAANALPVLRQAGFKATVFIPTGLMDNPGYLSWNTIADIAGSGDIMFSNHTWSHRNVGSDKAETQKEITTADYQLSEKNLNSPKVFSYPYGLGSVYAVDVVTALDYKLAFSTKSGSTQCKKMRFDLYRIRIGNTNIVNYGF